ncbi:MAG: hypothetical protein MSA77_05940 [Selenomonadales bacterium]|nr:hypothetical protein [Selenomonadales bacterium]
MVRENRTERNRIERNRIEQNRIEQNRLDSCQVVFAYNDLNINIDRPSVRGLDLFPVF